MCLTASENLSSGYFGAMCWGAESSHQPGFKSFVSTKWCSNKHILCITTCNNNTNQITDISTLQFICKPHNIMHIISKHSNGAAITLSGSSFGRICQRISSRDLHGKTTMFPHPPLNSKKFPFPCPSPTPSFPLPAPHPHHPFPPPPLTRIIISLTRPFPAPLFSSHEISRQ